MHTYFFCHLDYESRYKMRLILHLLIVSSLLHLIWLFSLFDIYFTSDFINHELMTPQTCPLVPPAKRLVLFAVNGLTADDVYSLDNITNAPFLRQIIKTQGRWGVAYSQFSRSGDSHIIPLSGIYKDHDGLNHWLFDFGRPALFDVKLYDSIIYASLRTLIWSPTNIFPLHQENRNFTINKYDQKDYDNFKYNSWVFKCIEDLFLMSSNEASVAKQLSDEKMLYYISLDVTNHSSINSIIKQVDEGIENTANLINTYFSDERTTFLVTGTPNIEQVSPNLKNMSLLPFISWGAGIKNPRSAQHGDHKYDDDLSEVWMLEKYERIDIEIIDIAPLVSILLGIRVPVHSMGVLPIGYIHYNKQFLAESLFTNARQFLELVRVNENRILFQSLPFLFRHYSKLPVDIQQQAIDRVANMIKQRKLQESIHASLNLITVCKEAISYFKTYHHFSIKASLSLAFVGWGIYIVTLILEKQQEVESLKKMLPSIWAIIFCLLVSILQYYQQLSFQHYIYHSLPILCWDLAIRNLQHLYMAVKDHKGFVVNALHFLLVFGAIELLTCSLYFRVCLTVLFVIISFCPLVIVPRSRQTITNILWAPICVILGCFPLLPHTLSVFVDVITTALAGVAIIIVCVYILSRPLVKYKLVSPSSIAFSAMFVMYVVMVLIVIIMKAIANFRLHNDKMVPSYVFYFSWSTLIFSVVMHFLGPSNIPGRLLHVAVIQLLVFMLLSTSIEPLFFLLLCLLLYYLLQTEERLMNKEDKNIRIWNGILQYKTSKSSSLYLKTYRTYTRVNDLYRIGFLIALQFLILFSLFDMDNSNPIFSARFPCFIVQSYSQGSSLHVALLILKLLIPSIYLGFTYNIVSMVIHIPLRSMFLLSYLILDIIAIQSFVITRNDDKSITAFVMIIILTLLTSLSLSISRLLSGFTIVPRKVKNDDC